jgi:hypothetical protein
MHKVTQDVKQSNSRQANSDAVEVVVAEWPINNRGESARVSLELYKVAWRIGCRKWFLDDDGKLCPTRQAFRFALNISPAWQQPSPKLFPPPMSED